MRNILLVCMPRPASKEKEEMLQGNKRNRWPTIKSSWAFFPYLTILRIVHCILQGDLCRYLFGEIFVAGLCFEKFSLSSYVLLSYSFFYLRLLDDIRFWYSQVLAVYFSCKCSCDFVIWKFISFSCLWHNRLVLYTLHCEMMSARRYLSRICT